MICCAKKPQPVASVDMASNASSRVTGNHLLATDSDDYVRAHHVTELFESLTAALAYKQPERHIDFLIDCLDTARRVGHENVFWDSFIPELSSRSSSVVTADVTRNVAQLEPITEAANVAHTHDVQPAAATAEDDDDAVTSQTERTVYKPFFFNISGQNAVPNASTGKFSVNEFLLRLLRRALTSVTD